MSAEGWSTAKKLPRPAEEFVGPPWQPSSHAPTSSQTRRKRDNQHNQQKQRERERQRRETETEADAETERKDRQAHKQAHRRSLEKTRQTRGQGLDRNQCTAPCGNNSKANVPKRQWRHRQLPCRGPVQRATRNGATPAGAASLTKKQDCQRHHHHHRHYARGVAKQHSPLYASSDCTAPRSAPSLRPPSFVP